MLAFLQHNVDLPNFVSILRQQPFIITDKILRYYSI